MNKHSINKINITFEFNTLDEANDFISKASTLSSLLKTSEEISPPAPQRAEEQIDVEALKDSIYDTLMAIHKNTGDSRSFLNNKGYTTIDLIPDDELVSFFEYLKSGSYE